MTIVRQKCLISRKDFQSLARPMLVKIGDGSLLADVTFFATGSFGWRISGKTMLVMKGAAIPVQVNMSAVVIGSKATASPEELEELERGAQKESDRVGRRRAGSRVSGSGSATGNGRKSRGR